jgi:hypothetical protein|tara:strand:- start:1080 stop:1424 length:345 start_codon:yes stop_codon:yes gene_type:complete
MKEPQINPFRSHRTMAGMQENYKRQYESTQKYVVDRGVPIPERYAGGRQVANTEKRVLLDAMKIGDSVGIITVEEYKRFNYVIGKMRKLPRSHRFTVRKIEGNHSNGWRIWRIA